MPDALPRRSLRHSLREATKALLLIAAGLIVLTLLLVPSIHVTLERNSRRDQADLEIRNFQKAAELYVLRRGRLPLERDGLRALQEAGVLETVPVDPWGNPYTLTVSERGQAEVSSLGADGKPGGDGRDADLVRRFKVDVPAP